MLVVTYQAETPVKQGRKWINKTQQWKEIIATEDAAKLRALALNWTIVSIEVVNE